MKTVQVSLTVFVVVTAIGLTAATSDAIPSFARKYETSCATCHRAYPQLNAFGEAFRRNGFQFPEGTDAQFIKQEPVSLGSNRVSI